jgi:hypothetical protein
MRERASLLTFPVIVALTLSLCWVSLSLADQPGLGKAGHHNKLNGIVTKIESGMIFVKTEGLQSRTFSINKADRMGLHEVKVGDTVALVVDENNVLVDVHKKGLEPAGHRMVTGNLHWTDPSGKQIKLATPKGVQSFDVDSMVSSKLTAVAKGQQVVVELDEANVVIDVHTEK